jgi:hypothetical protein
VIDLSRDIFSLGALHRRHRSLRHTIAIVWRSASPLMESAKAWSLRMCHSVRAVRTPFLVLDTVSPVLS